MNFLKIFFISIFTLSLNIFGERNYDLEILVDGLDHPWSLAELPSGEYLLTELPGNLKLISKDGSKITQISNVPKVLFRGQGGLSDIVLHPEYKKNGWIYFSYSAFIDEKKKLNTLFVDRAKIENFKLTAIENIFQAKAERNAPAHFGAKLFFLDDGTLMITSGDGFDFRESAQFLDNHFGKVLRINDDGSIPEDNPFVNVSGALPEIWSYGIRNPQGIFQDKDGLVYENEHGPRGGDELNILKPGLNYGWPAITHGIDYSGALISPFKEKEGMEQPIYYWTPSIAPSGMTIYEKDLFPEWKDKIFISNLVYQDVRLLELNENKEVISEEILFKEVGKRIRNIITLSNGELMIITDKKDGQLIKVNKI